MLELFSQGIKAYYVCKRISTDRNSRYWFFPVDFPYLKKETVIFDLHGILQEQEKLLLDYDSFPLEIPVIYSSEKDRIDKDAKRTVLRQKTYSMYERGVPIAKYTECRDVLVVGSDEKEFKNSGFAVLAVTEINGRYT